MARRWIDKSLLPFLLIGAGNTLISQGLMQALIGAGFGYWASSGTAFFLTSAASYFLNRRFSFHSQAPIRATLWRFALNILICYFVAYALARPATGWLLSRLAPSFPGNIDRVALLAGQGIFTGLNYLGQRFFTFGDSLKK